MCFHIIRFKILESYNQNENTFPFILLSESKEDANNYIKLYEEMVAEIEEPTSGIGKRKKIDGVQVKTNETTDSTNGIN